MPPSERKPIVFVVDDDADVRSGFKALLQSVNLDCEVFGSSEEFLRRKPADTVSCLVLDIRMPGPSGLDLQTELARIHHDIPIIFITGYGDIAMTVRAMKAGAVEFLTKPVREQDLLDAVQTALERDRQRRDTDDRMREIRRCYDTLSDREREVLMLVSTGLLNKQIAGQMKLSEVTVKVHRHNMMRKLGAKSVPDLVRVADLLGFVKKGSSGSSSGSDLR
jgi:FixJ family two-component response regulator